MLALWTFAAVALTVIIIAAFAGKCACACSEDACRCDGAHCVKCAGCATCKLKPHPTCNCDYCKKKRG